MDIHQPSGHFGNTLRRKNKPGAEGEQNCEIQMEFGEHPQSNLEVTRPIIKGVLNIGGETVTEGD